MRHMKASFTILATTATVSLLAASFASASTRPLHLFRQVGGSLTPLVLEDQFSLNTSGTVTLATTGGYVECPGGDTGSGETLLTEGTSADSFGLNSENSISGYPCSSSTGLGNANIVLIMPQLTLNSGGRVQAPRLEVIARFSSGVVCYYRGAHATARLAISSAPVPLSINFPGTRLLLDRETSWPICPKTSSLYATVTDSYSSEPVFAEN